jgi:hypothetical protein
MMLLSASRNRPSRRRRRFGHRDTLQAMLVGILQRIALPLMEGKPFAQRAHLSANDTSRSVSLEMAATLSAFLA